MVQVSVPAHNECLVIKSDSDLAKVHSFVQRENRDKGGCFCLSYVVLAIFSARG